MRFKFSYVADKLWCKLVNKFWDGFDGNNMSMLWFALRRLCIFSVKFWAIAIAVLGFVLNLYRLFQLI